jgi:hypothetical protein
MLQTETPAGRRPSLIPRPSVLHTGPNDRDRAGFAPTSVEEHREKAAGADGKTRTATWRRKGDRSCKEEARVDKEDKRTEWETRHTAGDDSIERFKRELSAKT